MDSKWLRDDPNVKHQKVIFYLPQPKVKKERSYMAVTVFVHPTYHFMTKKLLATLGILFCSFQIGWGQSPQWQWGKRGGSWNSSGAGGADDRVTDMATDKHGNIYVLSDVESPGVDVDGHVTPAYGGYDIMLSSFTCDGTYRWSKIIGSNGQDDYGYALKTDTLGGVYVMGTVDANATQLHIDADSTWVGGPLKDFFIAKFDTAGTYKWFRMPQPDTIGVVSRSADNWLSDMDVDEAGNIYLMSVLPPGAYSAGEFVIDTQGYYFLKYDRNGIFQSLVPLSIKYTGTLGSPWFLMKRDHQSGRIYLTGNTYGAVFLGTTEITQMLFVSSFPAAGGDPLWTIQNTIAGGWGVAFSRPAIDPEGAIYLSGCSYDGDTFNSAPIINPGGFGETPLVVKMDSNGHNIWCTNVRTGYDCDADYITVAGNVVAITGSYTGWFTWPGTTDTLKPPLGPGGYRLYYTTFDATTGAAQKLDSIGSPDGYFNEPKAMVHDNFGNFYMGGDFGAEIWLAGDTMISVGGGSDFYIAKYGTANCSAPSTLNTITSPVQERIFSVYPNPAYNELTITAQAKATYRLMAITGAMVQQGSLTAGENTVMLDSFVPGMYLLEIAGADGSRYVVKVVKQ